MIKVFRTFYGSLLALCILMLLFTFYSFDVDMKDVVFKYKNTTIRKQEVVKNTSELNKKQNSEVSLNIKWLEEYGIDISKISEPAVKILQKGYSYFGSLYAWGGKYPPTKDSGGKWVSPKATGKYEGGHQVFTGGFDCSGFTSWCIRDITGLVIGSSTYDQPDNPALSRVNMSDAKPGDIYFTQEHTGFFIKQDSSSIWIMDAPSTGKAVGIRQVNKRDGQFIMRIRGVY